MRASLATALLSLGVIASVAQSAQPAFDVASVRPSQHQVGPDYNNQISLSPGEFNGKNVTLRRLIAEAWQCQLDQVLGPSWLDQDEYDISARAAQNTTREQMSVMLRALLSDRFRLKQHNDTRQFRVYELITGPGGPKIHPVPPGSEPASGSGFHFHGDMRHFADLLAMQFAIPAPARPDEPVKAGGTPMPVLDKTGLQGTFDFTVNVRPELGTDTFTTWKRALEDELGLRIESRKADVSVIVVDDASKTPTAN